MMPVVIVPDVTRMIHGETRVFTWPSEYGDQEGFVLHYRGVVHAYRNHCPHWPIPLDVNDGVFYNASIDRIRCRTHGASFLPESGVCDSGPCGGESLTRFDLEIDGEDALVLIP
jgi:nitrite reductase/ring-hydroxylating ferredoxin subunit